MCNCPPKMSICELMGDGKIFLIERYWSPESLNATFQTLKLSHLTTRFDRMFKISWRDRWCTNRPLQRIYTILDYVSTNLADKARLHHQYSWSCSLVDRRQSRRFYTACTSTSKSLSDRPDSLHVAWKCLRRRSSEVLAFSHSPVGQTFLVSCFDSWFNNV